MLPSIRIGLPPTMVFFPVFAAGILERDVAHGVKIEFVDLPGPNATEAMLDGRVDLSATFAERPITFLLEGKRLKNIMALLNENPLALVARADAGVTEVKDLKGRRIASTYPKAGSNLALLAILRWAGLDPSQGVSINFVGVDGVRREIQTGAADAAIMPSDYAALSIYEGSALALVDPRRNQGPEFVRRMNFTSLQAGERVLHERGDLVARVVSAVVETQRLLRGDRHLAEQIAARKFPGMPPQVLCAILDADMPTYHPAITESAMRDVEDGLRGTVLSEGDPPVRFTDVVATEFENLWV